MQGFEVEDEGDKLEVLFEEPKRPGSSSARTLRYARSGFQRCPQASS
jgi:hypothetical protein